MPAIITHHLFGEDAANILPEETIVGQEELLAFLLGNQGPDPLYARFSTRPAVAKRCHKLADALYDSKVVEAFIAARNAVVHLSEDDKRVGRAFVLGFLGHYVLDSTTHPFVYAQQHAICDAGEGLQNLGSEVHALIESDIDVWMLWNQRGLTVEDAPVTQNLAHTDRVTRVAGAIISQVAHEVFQIEVGTNEYGNAVNDYELTYALIDPAGTHISNAIGHIERKFRHKSYLQALAHRVSEGEDSASVNLERHRWRDPYAGKSSTDSFADLYFIALDRWPSFADALIAGDATRLKRLACGINYNGEAEI